MSKPIVTMMEAEATLGRAHSGGLRNKNKKCLVIANEPDNSLVISLRESAGIVVKVRFDTLAAIMANEIARVKEAEEKSANEEKDNIE